MCPICCYEQCRKTSRRNIEAFHLVLNALRFVKVLIQIFVHPITLHLIDSFLANRRVEWGIA
jgi:hypothetical protein